MTSGTTKIRTQCGKAWFCALPFKRQNVSTWTLELVVWAARRRTWTKLVGSYEYPVRYLAGSHGGMSENGATKDAYYDNRFSAISHCELYIPRGAEHTIQTEKPYMYLDFLAHFNNWFSFLPFFFFLFNTYPTLCLWWIMMVCHVSDYPPASYCENMPLSVFCHFHS